MTSFLVQPAARPLLGSARVPGDKSIGHRSLLLGALASEPVTVCGLSGGADNHRTRRAIEALGVRVEERTQEELTVFGAGLDGLRAPPSIIDCGNSGTTMRLLCGILAAQHFDSVLMGDESLSSRPMRRVTDPLVEMGARISGAAGARAGDLYPPLQIHGLPGGVRLRGLSYSQPVASAQVKSALLLAGMYADGPTTIVEPGRSRDHTERMLQYMGAPLSVERDTIRLDPSGWSRSLRGGKFAVPGDPSSAAFLVVAALVAGCERVTVREVCVNKRRTGFLDVLVNLGARVEQDCWSDTSSEPTADLVVSGGAGDALEGTVIAGDLTVRSLDELPILAIVAARAKGVSNFCDAEELRVKESDRIATTCAMLRALGVEVEERPDGFALEGLAGRPFAACEIDARGDHRIAMSGVIAGLAASGPVLVRDVDNVATSFPTFVEVMRGLGADIVVRDA